tara:strand:- start:51 stop:221 length:171 start_codon:yes stop_codon:yes gene_type:complete
MLIGGHEIGVSPDPEKIKLLITEKKKDLERVKRNFTKRQERADEQLKKLKAYEKED